MEALLVEAQLPRDRLDCVDHGPEEIRIGGRRGGDRGDGGLREDHDGGPCPGARMMEREAPCILVDAADLDPTGEDVLAVPVALGHSWPHGPGPSRFPTC